MHRPTRPMRPKLSGERSSRRALATNTTLPTRWFVCQAKLIASTVYGSTETGSWGARSDHLPSGVGAEGGAVLLRGAPLHLPSLHEPLTHAPLMLGEGHAA